MSIAAGNMNEREIALFILMDISDTGAYNNIALRKTLNSRNELTSSQKAFVTELVNGTLRNIINIDYVINLFSDTKTDRMKPFILNDLRLGVYQILYMPSVPVSAACNEAVKLAKKRQFSSLSGFVNAVLRNIARSEGKIAYPRDKKKAVSLEYSVPEWIIDYWLEDMDIGQIEKMCASFSQPPKICVCVNTLKTDKNTLKQRLSEEGISCDECTLLDNSLYIYKTGDISESQCFKEGLFHIMDESSILAVNILDPSENSVILDMCAAPGGKSFALAQKTNDNADIYSCDIYEHKVRLTEKGAQRLGINSIKPLLKDACRPYNMKADFILLDAPCSGLGLIRKKPDIKYNRKYEDILSLAEIQRKMLVNAVNTLEKGGTLVYSTCTISHRENKDNIDWLLSQGGVKAADISDYVPQSFKCTAAEDGYLELLPHNTGTDGFFIAKLKKI